MDDEENPLYTGEGWMHTPITIDIPMVKAASCPFQVSSLHHRSILNILVTALQAKHTPSSAFHFTPCTTYYNCPTPHNPKYFERVYDEIYSSDIFLWEFLKIQEAAEYDANGNECTLERGVCACMIWSDATQLGNFGKNKLWPGYLVFGNQSKRRERECHHFAYFPEVGCYLIAHFQPDFGPAPCRDHGFSTEGKLSKGVTRSFDPPATGSFSSLLGQDAG
jgi:hypothetical protein